MAGRGAWRVDTESSLLYNIEHGAERYVPLLCIDVVPPYHGIPCGIVLIVERAIENPQVRKEFSKWLTS